MPWQLAQQGFTAGFNQDKRNSFLPGDGFIKILERLAHGNQNNNF